MSGVLRGPGAGDLTAEYACEAGVGVDRSSKTPHILLCAAVPTRLYRIMKINIHIALCDECAPAIIERGDVQPLEHP